MPTAFDPTPTTTKDSTALRPAQDQLVSQDEVELLLAEMSRREPSEDDSPLSDGSRPDPAPVMRHTFPKLSFFSASELRKLRVRHEEFIRSLSARLAVYLRLEIGLRMCKLETSSFQKFVDGLASPTHLTFVRLAPLDGICLLETPPRLALSFVDRDLGGPAVYLDEARELSSMETRLLNQVLEIIVGELCNSWSDLIELGPALVGQESSGRYVQTSPPQHTMLLLGIEVHLGELVEQIQLAFPYQTLEALLVKLTASPAASGGSVAAPKPPARWNSSVAEVKITVAAKLPPLQLTTGQLASLRAGDTLPLPDGIFNRVSICLQNEARFIGGFGTCGDHSAVRIDQKIEACEPAAPTQK